MRKRSMFTTAGGGEVTISEEALNRAKAMQVFRDDEESKPNSDSGSTHQEAPISSGFMTARGSTVNVSDEARKRARALLGGPGSNQEEQEPARTASKFTTASLKPVTISEEAHKHAKGILMGVDNVENRVNGSSCVDGGAAPKRRKSMFATAGGGAVTVSEDAVSKATTMLQGAAERGVIPTTTREPTSREPSQKRPPQQPMYTAPAPTSEPEPEPEPEPAHSTHHATLYQQQHVEQLGASRQDDLLSALTTPATSRSALTAHWPDADTATESNMGSWTLCFPPCPARKAAALAVALQISSYNASRVSFDAFRGGDPCILPVDNSVDGSRSDGNGSGNGSGSSRSSGRRSSSSITNSREECDEDRAWSTALLPVVLPLVERQAGCVIHTKSDVCEWLCMQLRSITWTLACLERRAGVQVTRMGGCVDQSVMLTLPNVLDEVLRRYSIYRASGGSRTASNRKSTSTPASASASASVSASASDPSPTVTHTTTTTIPASSRVRRTKRLSYAQSPLQRCTGISQFVWPMVLVLAVSGGPCSGVSQAVVEVTDGWWWARAHLDKELSGLLRRGALRDGCKIAVLGATFESEAATTTSIRLSYNNVRRARGNAGLGYIPPSHLNRGLSVRSLRMGGGHVYALRGVVQYTGHTMSKFTHQSAMGDGRCYTCYLDSAEAREVSAALENARHIAATSVSYDPGLTLEAVLDHLGCSEPVAAAVRELESGGGGMEMLSRDSDLATEVAHVRRKLPETLQAMRAELMQSRLGQRHSEWKENQVHDALLMCALAFEPFWLRVPGGRSVRHQLHAGRHLMATNLKMLHGISGLACPVAVCGGNSLLKTLRSPANIAEAMGLQGAAQVCAPSIRSVCLQEALLPAEISFRATLLSYETVSLAEGAVTELTLRCTDATRSIALITYTIPSMAEGTLTRWLVPGTLFEAELVLCRSYDARFDILTCTRHDRSRLRPVTTTSSPVGTAAAAEGSSDEVETESSASVSVAIRDEESARFTAIVAGRPSFDAIEPAGRSEATVRATLRHVSVQLTKRICDGDGKTVKWSMLVRSRDGVITPLEAPAHVCLPSSVPLPAVLAPTGRVPASDADTDMHNFSLQRFLVVVSEVWDYNPACDDMEMQRRVVWLGEEHAATSEGIMAAGRRTGILVPSRVKDAHDKPNNRRVTL